MNPQEIAWKLRQEGKSYGDIAEELKVSKSTAYKYVRDYQKNEEKEHETADKENNSISTYLESPSQQIEVVDVNRVVEEINRKITVVEEPVDETIEKNKKEKIQKKISPNKYTLALLIISAGIILGVVYYLFRQKKTGVTKQPAIQTQDMKKIDEEIQKEVKKETALDHAKRAGFEEGVVLGIYRNLYYRILNLMKWKV